LFVVASWPTRILRTGLTRCVSIILVGGALLAGCSLVPQKPDAVFLLYRDRMKAGNLAQARELLSDESRKLAVDLESTYRLRQPPENLALLNILDPVGSPVVMKEGDASALLQARTLKGGLRLIRLVRSDEKSPWKIDMVEELAALRVFLEARGALDMIREQAGEYAAFWKAFTDQLGRMRAPEEPLRELKEKKPDKPKRKEPPRRKPTTKPSTKPSTE